MSVNKVVVIGNLGANPNIRALPSGQNVANFSLATTERFTDRNGGKQEHTDWHRIVRVELDARQHRQLARGLRLRPLRAAVTACFMTGGSHVPSPGRTIEGGFVFGEYKRIVDRVVGRAPSWSPLPCLNIQPALTTKPRTKRGRALSSPVPHLMSRPKLLLGLRPPRLRR
jgi:hypothetical protein